jgi:putative salt-induced outer membrane protein YdiY
MRAQDPAQAAAAAPVSPFKLQLDVGLVNVAGNTRLTSFSLGDNLEFKSDPWKVIQFANIVYGKSGDSTTAEQYKFGGRVDRQLFLVVHGFFGGTYERNTFAGIAHRTTEYAGLAIVLLDLPADLLDFDVGSALSQQASSAAAPDRTTPRSVSGHATATTSTRRRISRRPSRRCPIFRFRPPGRGPRRPFWWRRSRRDLRSGCPTW